MKVKELKAKANQLKAEIHVGKQGLSKEIVAELNRRLNKRNLIKVKADFPENEDKKVFAGRIIAGRVGANLVEVKGNTIVLHRKGK